MDNRINQIRKKISALRVKMLETERAMRDQINQDLDCSETSLRLIAMRAEMVGLVTERQALGDRAPIVVESLPVRTPEVRKPRARR